MKKQLTAAALAALIAAGALPVSACAAEAEGDMAPVKTPALNTTDHMQYMNGYTDGTFRPDATITRAEVTTIVNRMLSRSADESFIDEHADEIRQFTDLNDSYWGYYNIMEAANAHDFTTENNTETWTALR